ncbi:hypothetical protein ACP4OV_025288 [Aristida adscensionis]
MGIPTGSSVRGTPELRTAVNSSAPRCQEDDVSKCAQNMGEEVALDRLPEDIFDHLYSLVPLQDAARAACVSRGFLHSWRRYPRLVFNNQTLGLKRLKLHLDEEAQASKELQCSRANKIENHFADRINHILKNHSGFGVKIAVKPGIRELTLELSWEAEYNFPCSLLSDEIGGATVQSVSLSSCGFHPTATLCCTKNLTSLCLNSVRITGEELGQFVSNCVALVRLSISSCDDVTRFKVPCPLQQLDHLEVTYCEMLFAIEINAPKLSSFVYGEKLTRISLGAEVKHITMLGNRQPNIICRARAELPSFMPAIERLTVESWGEMVRTPIMPSKFIHLKYLDIFLLELNYGYDYFCLVSFLDASPALETFTLRVQRTHVMCFDSVLGYFDEDELRRMPDCRHDKLKNVTITGFCSSKSMTELASHIDRNAPALARMTLDTAHGCHSRNGENRMCLRMCEEALMEAQRGFRAVRRFVKGGVASSSSLKVLAPCDKCSRSLSCKLTQKA